MLKRILNTGDQRTTILIRLMVGGVFLSEGIQKFLFADKLGAGRFVKIGLPIPDFLGPFVGIFEITCGFLLIVGLLTRLATIPLLAIMLVAIAFTKIQLLANNGFWSLLHDSRTDITMILGCIFLLLEGGGKWSADSQLQKRGAAKLS